MLQRLDLGEYFGSPVQRLRAHGILITENRFEPNRTIDRHEHAYCHFTAVLQGGFDETYDSAAFECRARSVLVVPAKAPHIDEIGSDGAHSLSIELSRGLSNRVARESELLLSPRILRSPKVFAAARSIHAEFRRGTAASLIRVEHLVLGLLGSANEEATLSRKSVGPSWIAAVIAQLNADPAHPPKLNELAEIAGVHATHLSRSFRAATGKSLPQFVAERRLERAATLLNSTQMSLGEIAAECGFADQAHFARTFKQQFGGSPSLLRKAC